MKVIIMGILWIHKNYDNDNCFNSELKIIKSIRKEKAYIRDYETKNVARG